MTILEKIIENRTENKKMFAVLIDPGKLDYASLQLTVEEINKNSVDFILVGGSIISVSIDEFVATLRSLTKLPVVLFPGNIMQITPRADALLFMSLISGRNAELLIGNHVAAAPLIKESNLEVIPTGYMLIDTGCITSVEYISNTKPIPANKPEIAVATALAGEMLGLKLLYLEGGSGGQNTIPTQIISAVRSQVKVPLIVGGGIRTETDVEQACLSGADVVVVGTAIEENISNISRFAKLISEFK